jgi:hypothetical protein
MRNQYNASNDEWLANQKGILKNSQWILFE